MPVLSLGYSLLKCGNSLNSVFNLCWVGMQLATEEAKNFRDRNIFIVLVPNKAQKAQEPPKKQDKSAANEVSASV